LPNAPIHSRSSPPQAVQDALARLPDSAWTPVETTADYVISETVIDIAGQPTVARRTQYIADETLQAANAQEYADSEGKRWKDGRVVARVPLNKVLAEMGPYLRSGDRDFTRWWLNRPENLPFRTFRGKV
jgi:hypothetical protein